MDLNAEPLEAILEEAMRSSVADTMLHDLARECPTVALHLDGVQCHKRPIKRPWETPSVTGPYGSYKAAPSS
jgi:hypothetical protein